MRTVQWLAVAVVSAASLSLPAQQIGANVQQSTSASPAASTNTTGNAIAQMRPVRGELQSKLNSKNAKAGDQVIVTTTEKVTTAEGVVIPRGTRVIGHVVSAQAQVKGQAGSQLAIAFDRAELKHGETVAIHSILLSVAPPITYMPMPDESPGAGMGGSGMAPGSMAGGASGNTPGGAQGGMNGAINGAGNGVDAGSSTLNRAGSDLSNATAETMNAATRISANGTDAASDTANTALGGVTSMSAHATTLPGVMLSPDPSGSTSGVLTAKGRNVELDFRTRLVLGIVAQK